MNTITLSVNLSYIFVLLVRPPPISTLFPYTTLFRSSLLLAGVGAGIGLAFASPLIKLVLSMSGRGGGPITLDARLDSRSEEHTSELQSRRDLVCRLLLEKKKKQQ